MTCAGMLSDPSSQFLVIWKDSMQVSRSASVAPPLDAWCKAEAGRRDANTFAQPLQDQNVYHQSCSASYTMLN
jgi:hypothetical protein